VRPEGLGKFKNSPHRESNSRFAYREQRLFVTVKSLFVYDTKACLCMQVRIVRGSAYLFAKKLTRYETLHKHITNSYQQQRL
jgi:hypothetical protein